MALNEKINTQLQRWVGKEVWIEGTFPMPLPSGDVLYSPMVGVLREIFDDGVVITPVDDSKHEIVVLRDNLRSIALAKKGAKIAGRSSGLIS